MSKAGHIFTIIILIAIIATGAILLYVYMPAIKGTIEDSKYLTAEQGKEMYDKGYNKGNAEKKELTAKITNYETLIDEYLTQIQVLNNELSALNATNTENASTITELTRLKNENLETIRGLNNTITTNNATIVNLNTEITNLTAQKNSLQTELTNAGNENANLQSNINSLTTQISNLQAVKTQLEQINTSNLNTIQQLNAQIVSLNTQISTLSSQVLSNSQNVLSLNNQISELENSIQFYQTFIQGFKNENQAIATFMFNGSVYNIQVVAKGSTASVTIPTNTQYIIFNGWKVENASVNLAEYIIQNDTTFIADLTYKYAVAFKIDNETYDSQIVTENSFATLPTDPTKTGYRFDGWTINGTDIVNVAEYTITATKTFVAKFTKIHTVTFMYESETLSEQQIINNGNAVAPTVAEDTAYKIFNGWKVNNVFVNVAEMQITADTVFVADITYKFDVNFMFDEEEYDSQIVTGNSFATLPEEPTKAGYKFMGWTIDGTTVIDVATYAITAATTFIARLDASATVLFTNDGEEYDSQNVVLNSYATVPSETPTNGECFVFAGWSVDGTTIVNVSTYEITEDTVFVAKYNNIWVGEWKNGNRVVKISANRNIYYSDSNYNNKLVKALADSDIKRGQTSWTIWEGNMAVYYNLNYIDANTVYLYIETMNDSVWFDGNLTTQQ